MYDKSGESEYLDSVPRIVGEVLEYEGVEKACEPNRGP